MRECVVIFVGVLVACGALPTDDPIISKYEEERYQYVRAPDGTAHLTDMWLKASDLREAARFFADLDNVYYLYTRQNPLHVQILKLGDEASVINSNFDPSRRTVVLIHGWLSNVTTEFNAEMVPAYLIAADVNVIVADWYAGAANPNYLVALVNSISSGESVARFINWLNEVSGATPAQYHLVGHSLGGHQVGIVGRNVHGNIDYITSVDPANPGWNTNTNRFKSDDGTYTEVIHTNVGIMGYLPTLGDVDFYPNGGINMPGCSDSSCDHYRALHYLAESLKTGGFTGRRCLSYISALVGSCSLSGELQMGGVTPKTGSSGVYYLTTNADSLYSVG